MSEDNEVRPCCEKYSRPEQQCDRYPACDTCQHLIADEPPNPEEASQRAEEALDSSRFDATRISEPMRDPLY